MGQLSKDQVNVDLFDEVKRLRAEVARLQSQSVNSKSEYEAYTHLLIKRDELKKQLDNMNMQMDFLLINIKNSNFKDLDNKKGAMQELNYLISSSAKVSERAKELSVIAEELFKDLYKNTGVDNNGATGV